MIKNVCVLCGTEIKMNGGDLCSDCSLTRKKVAACGDDILRVATDVAASLKLKGASLKAETEAFEKKLVESFLTEGRKIMDERFASLEEARKGGGA
jgi:hypothetical protein